MEKIQTDVWQWFCKIGIPALVAVTISVATEVKNRTFNWLTTGCSVVIGMCVAYICGGFILSYFSIHVAPIVIAAITICGEKISYWLLYKANFDQIGDAFLKWLKDRFSRK